MAVAVAVAVVPVLDVAVPFAGGAVVVGGAVVEGGAVVVGAVVGVADRVARRARLDCLRSVRLRLKILTVWLLG
ncbi:hypothetical protein [Arthrobacter sp. JZ12]|uniref:hypothetical protein n=1 Tax=Arthrobacter sp. JZ12 TaxID=2654190 RepID=UPI002B485764|nr:hypothetical protein [Arthrobacter sp. JZ12]